MSEKKKTLLGMSHGTAFHRLRKQIMFSMARRLEIAVCFRCKCDIETVEEFSVEHKESWERAADPVAAFFDLENIAFSHRVCNIAAAHKPTKRFNSKKECALAYQPIATANRRAAYTPEKRRAKYLRSGH